ncbi:MAG: hypothetical protein Ct9H300mP4_15230 [Gammaproteobacteria bacterium]|nr:MAG: hypothetical protein Ct9H300mP4_15230 [Gammaproteobacteria bacterium]
MTFNKLLKAMNEELSEGEPWLAGESFPWQISVIPLTLEGSSTFN